MADPRAWKRFKKNKLALAGLVLTVIVVFVSLFAPALAPFPYDAQFVESGLSDLGAPMPPMSPVDEVLVIDGEPAHFTGTFLLGTDRMGRDVLSRLLWGSQVSLCVGLVATFIAAILGLFLGVVSGFFGNTECRPSAPLGTTIRLLAIGTILQLLTLGIGIQGFDLWFVWAALAVMAGIVVAKIKNIEESFGSIVRLALCWSLVISLIIELKTEFSNVDLPFTLLKNFDGESVSAGWYLGLSLVTISLGLLYSGAMLKFRESVIPLDTILQRITDFVLSFPFLLFVIALATLVGGNQQFLKKMGDLRSDLTNSGLLDALGLNVTLGNLTTSVIVLLALGLLGWTTSSRVIRGKTLSVKEKEFVEAARSLGGGTFYIIRRHILPNVIGPLIVLASMGVAASILAESTLSYLGLGVPQPIASWGNMIQDGQPYFRTAPWLVIYPGICILIVVLGFNLLGDGLRDILDPKEFKGSGRVHLPFLKWFWLLPALALMGIILTGMQGASEDKPIHPKDNAEFMYGGILRTASTDSIRSLDPAIAYDAESAMAEHLLYDSLVDYDDHANIIPHVAKSWEISEDGLTYTFHMRDNVWFHPHDLLGPDRTRRCVAADYKYSIERVLKPGTGSPAVPFYQIIEGSDEVVAGKAETCSGIILDPEDPLKITFRLKEPRLIFLNILAMPFASAIPHEVAEVYGRDYTNEAIGTGPFKLGDRRTGQYIEFDRFDRHWDSGKPYLDGVRLDEGVAREVASLKFQKGEYDTIYRITSPDYIYLASSEEWKEVLIMKPAVDVFAELMNTQMKPFDNKKVRQAFNWAINKEKLKKLRNGRMTIANGVLPPSMPGYNPDLKGYGFDPEKAKQLLAEAGYPNGIEEAITYWHLNDEASSQTAQSIQADLAAVGVKLNLHPVTFPGYLSAVGKPGTVQMAYTAWIQDFPDPSNFLETKFHSKFIAEQNSSNDVYIANPELDALLDAAASEVDPEKRLKMYQEAEKLVVEEAYWVFEYHSMHTELAQPYVQGERGYKIHPVWPRNYRDVAFKPRADGKDAAPLREAP